MTDKKTEVQEQPTTTNGAQPAANPDPATSSNYTELVGTLVKQRDPQSRFISNEKLIITRQGADGTPTTHPLLPGRQEVLQQAAQEADIITAAITSGQMARLPFQSASDLPLLSQYMGATMAHLVSVAHRPPWTCAVMNATDVASYDDGLLSMLAVHGRFYRVRTLIAIPDLSMLDRHRVRAYLLANASAVLALPTCDTETEAAQAIAEACKDVWRVDLDETWSCSGSPENAPRQAILITGEEEAV